MRLILKLILFSIALTSCEDPNSWDTPSFDGITLKTDKNSYTVHDSIKLEMVNNSDYDIELGFRCSMKNLEMFYQQKIDDKWSENKWFTYMNLKCMTIQYELKSSRVLKHSFLAMQFDTTGTFRLLVPYYIPEKDSNIVVVSNSFEIKK